MLKEGAVELGKYGKYAAGGKDLGNIGRVEARRLSILKAAAAADVALLCCCCAANADFKSSAEY